MKMFPRIVAVYCLVFAVYTFIVPESGACKLFSIYNPNVSETVECILAPKKMGIQLVETLQDACHALVTEATSHGSERMGRRRAKQHPFI
jgi:hypothetical protein